MTTDPGPTSSLLPSLLRTVIGSRIQILLVFLPIAIALHFANVNSLAIFATSAIAVIPLAALIGRSTEELAHRAGAGIGGVLNATFGNGAELLIGAFAIQHGLYDVVKASIAGSIISNLLLVLGLAALVGGLKHDSQYFNRTGASTQSLMLFLAVAGLAMPAIYDLTVLGDMKSSNFSLDLLSLLTSLVLIGAYLAGLVFSLRTHKSAFIEYPRDDKPVMHLESDQSSAATMTTSAAVVLLAIATVGTAVAAELLVGSVEETAHTLGLNDLFIGMIVIAIVGNAAEHFSAVLVARNNNMQLAINIAKESSVQIALLVAPLLVLLSWMLGRPMNLVFHPFELVGTALAVIAVAVASRDGETNWYEGLLLVSLYAILAIAVFFIPAH